MTDYTELIRSLRNCSNNRCTPCDCGWFNKYQVDESCKEIIMWKAAAAIEELQAEVERLEPKRGEWIGRQNHKKCSVCGKQAIYDVALYTDMKTPYCPHCGAKMEVQE